MYKHILYLLFVVLTGFLIISCQHSTSFECTDSIACVEITPDESIKIGVLQALSGPLAHVGTLQIQIFARLQASDSF